MPRSVLRLLQSNPTVQIEGEFENEFEIANDAPLVGYVMNADGTSQTRLTNNPAQDVRPDWQRVAAPSATPVPSPPASPTPTAFPPSVSRIPDQTLAQDNAVTVPFTITGAVIAYALQVSVSSSNATLLPVSASTLFATCQQSGVCMLTIRPAGGRSGTTTVTITVSDGTLSTSTGFFVTVTTVKPSAPPLPAVTVSGSGLVLTWNPPDTGTPAAYAIAIGTDPGASNLPVQLLSGTTTRLDLPAVPTATYYFQVYALGSGDLSPASNLVSRLAAGNAAAPGPPMAAQSAASPGGFTASWRPPVFGATPTLYEVQVGTGLGLSDIRSATTTTTSLAATVSTGTYWTRTRAASGGTVGIWDTPVQFPIGAAACTSAPSAPIMLPVMAKSGQVTFNWWPTGTVGADSYGIQIAQGLGLASIGTLASPGPGTSYVWGQLTGSLTARIVAVNACGTSARSNEVAFTIQP